MKALIESNVNISSKTDLNLKVIKIQLNYV
jgi:hypothetical protein